METIQKIVDYLCKEWRVVRAAPLAFVLVSALGLVGGYLASSWYYGGRLAMRDDQIGRYRVALGIEEASGGRLIELGNVEMKSKAVNLASALRELDRTLQRRMMQVQEEKLAGRIDEQIAIERSKAIESELSQEFDRRFRADAINVDGELRRRLRPSALATIVGLPPSFYDERTGAPISALALTLSVDTITPSVTFAATLAEGIDRMAAILPSDHTQSMAQRLPCVK